MALDDRALTIRGYSDRDQDAVLALINADCLPGQPSCTPDMLQDSLIGLTTFGTVWRPQMSVTSTSVLVGPNGHAEGVVSTARHPAVDVGLVLWLHGRERPPVVSTLVRHALDDLASCSRIVAFDVAPATTLGLEGLPLGQRIATHAALHTAGFRVHHVRRYLSRPVGDHRVGHGLPSVGARLHEISHDRVEWLLEMQRGAYTVAEAVVGPVIGQSGLVQWLETGRAHRRRGLGRALLGRALDLLAAHGASHAIAVVDCDAAAAAGVGDPIRFFTACGFREVDRLVSYLRRCPPAR